MEIPSRDTTQLPVKLANITSRRRKARAKKRKAKIQPVREKENVVANSSVAKPVLEESILFPNAKKAGSKGKSVKKSKKKARNLKSGV